MIGVVKMYYQTAGTLALLSAMMISTIACTKQIATKTESIAAETVGPRTVKTGAALNFSHRMQSPIVANTSQSVTLTVSHDYAGQPLSLTATSDAAVQLGAKTAAMTLTKGRSATWTIPFTVTADGVYYINIIGTVKRADGNVEARAYAIRVQVGNQVEIKKPAPSEILLPAEENISKP